MTEMAIEATTRVKTLIALTEELTSIIEQENTLLHERRPQAIAPLQNDKARLAAAFAQSIREIARDRASVAGASDALMIKLRELTATFEQRAEEQHALLDGARTATESVLKAVADETREKPASYGDGADKTAPLILNQRV
ncbi:MAG: hypothetical protein KDA46_06515 [Parvularculaceae bacterium]|nr:hypothetical protein [Parvularculaceae bacterium]